MIAAPLPFGGRISGAIGVGSFNSRRHSPYVAPTGREPVEDSGMPVI
jgi:hypothetical protein